MSGQPHKSGGSRKHAGRPRRVLNLDRETARTLRFLVRLRENAITEEQLVKELVNAKWREYDQAYQEAAEEAQEPYIL